MSKTGKKILILTLLAATGVAVVGGLSKGFKDWNIESNFNSIKDSLFPSSSSDSIEDSSSTGEGTSSTSENQLVTTDINFATTFTGITGTIGKQRSDLVANNKLIAYSNQARIYGGKFIVGKTGGDTDSAFASVDTLERLTNLYSQIGDLEVKNVSGVSSKATWCNYVGFQTGNLDSTKALSLKFTYTFDYGSSINFRVEPFATGNNSGCDLLAGLDTGFDRTQYQYITYSDVTNDAGKVQQTMTVNLIPFGGDNGLYGGYYDMFGIAIYGLNTDTRLTINTAQLITTEELPNHGIYFDYYVPNAVEGVKVVSSNGIAVKNVSTGTDEDSHSFVTINYALTPTNTTDTSLIATIGWVSSAVTDNAALFLKAEINALAKTLKVTCLQAFSNQMKVVISSTIDSSKTATITFDVAQKFLGFNGVQDLYIPYFFDGTVYHKSFGNILSEETLISKLTNGFSTVFTTGIATSAVVSNYSYEAIDKILYSDEWNGSNVTAEASFTEDDNLPESTKCVQSTALFDDSFDTYSGALVHYSDLISRINSDASTYWTNGQLSFVKNSAIHLGIQTQAHFDLTIAGLTVRINVQYLAIVKVSDLTLNIPLNAISPEVSNFTF